MGDRMRKALEHNDYSVQSAADYFGVTRGTVSNWIHGRTPVPLEWLQTGATVPTPPDWKETGYKSGRTGHLASMEDYVTAA